MAQNVSYANNDSILESLVLNTLPDFGENGDGIINNNFLLAALREKKRFREIDGGLEFWKGVVKQENTNFKWQAHTDTMNVNLQDPQERLRFAIKTFTGSVVINKLHEAQNKGRAMVKNWAQMLRDQAESTIPNQFNSAFWAATPGTDEPESIPSLISATPTTGTIGGLSRSGRDELQNGLYSDSTSIGAQAGLTYLKRAQIHQAVMANDIVDIVILPDTLYASLVGYLGTLNRYRPDERMAELDFDTINVGSTLISFENTSLRGSQQNTITSTYGYGINSKHLWFEALKEGNFMWNPEGFERVPLTLNKALYFWVFCNLTTNLPRAHFVMTALTA